MIRFFIAALGCLLVLSSGMGFAQQGQAPAKSPEAQLQEIQKAIEEKGAHWTAGMNDIFRLPPEERRRYMGLTDSVSLERIPEAQQVLRYSWHPQRFDWRSVEGANWTSPVKNQGACGSCAAFASVGTFEIQLNIFNNNPRLNMNLSESHLYFCHERTCETGWQINEAAEALMVDGTTDEDCFPYSPTVQDSGIDLSCGERCSDWRTRTMKTSCWGWVSGKDAVHTPAELKEQILKGPVMSGMTVYDDFQAYRGGIYQHVTGTDGAGHAVVMVGWDDTTNPPCWIVRNSWGLWGEGGYFRIRMGTNEVGIESRNVFMVLGEFPKGKITDNGHLFGKVDVGET